MKNLLVVLLLAIAGRISAQDTLSPPPPPPANCDTCGPILYFAEEMPHFPGGENAFQDYLKTNIHYPDSSLKYDRQGTVYVKFKVAKDGSIQDVTCMKGVPEAPELCEEAVRVITLMPKWVPGKMDRKDVNVWMTIPIRFTLH